MGRLNAYRFGWLVFCALRSSSGQGQIHLDNYTCFSTEIYAADQIYFLAKSKHFGRGHLVPAWPHNECQYQSHWLGLEPNLQHSRRTVCHLVIEVDACTIIYANIFCHDFRLNARQGTYTELLDRDIWRLFTLWVGCDFRRSLSIFCTGTKRLLGYP